MCHQDKPSEPAARNRPGYQQVVMVQVEMESSCGISFGKIISFIWVPDSSPLFSLMIKLNNDYRKFLKSAQLLIAIKPKQ